MARLKHACGVLSYGNKKLVVVAGGIDAYGDTNSNIETFVVTEITDSIFHFDEEWKYGPSLPMLLSDAASATTSNQQALLLVGGHMIDHGVSQSVLKFTCSNIVDLECSWTKLDYELKPASVTGLTLTMTHIAMVEKGYSSGRECAKGNFKYAD